MIHLLHYLRGNTIAFTTLAEDSDIQNNIGSWNPNMRGNLHIFYFIWDLHKNKTKT